MRDLKELDAHRVRSLEEAHARRHGMLGNPDPANVGIFVFEYKKALLRCFVSNGLGWDHVSVSCASRCPTWTEMEFIKRKFFKPEEWAFQLHAPPDDHVNVHPYCLHIWRPHNEPIPIPPRELV